MSPPQAEPEPAPSGPHSPQDRDDHALRQLGTTFLLVSLVWLVLASVQGVWRLEDLIGPGLLATLGASLTAWAARRQRAT